MPKLSQQTLDERRANIMDAARRCFARNGIHVSVDELCAEAGVSKGALYGYFPSKEAIIGAMADLHLTEMTQRFREAALGNDAIPALLGELRRKKSQIRRATPMLLEMLTEADRNPAIAKIMRESSRRMRDLLADLLRKGQASHQIDPALDPETAATVLMGVLDGLKIVTLREPRFDLEEGLALMETMIARFLTPPGREAQAASAPSAKEQTGAH